jgi:hypothetical protein
MQVAANAAKGAEVDAFFFHASPYPFRVIVD